jgi:hypothetical protein
MILGEGGSVLVAGIINLCLLKLGLKILLSTGLWETCTCNNLGDEKSAPPTKQQLKRNKMV